VSATADEQLAFAGPGALRQLLRGGELSARELVESCLRRIESLEPRLNAFRTAYGVASIPSVWPDESV